MAIASGVPVARVIDLGVIIYPNPYTAALDNPPGTDLGPVGSIDTAPRGDGPELNPAAASRVLNIATINGDSNNSARHIPNSAIDNSDDIGRSDNTSDAALSTDSGGLTVGRATGGNHG